MRDLIIKILREQVQEDYIKGYIQSCSTNEEIKLTLGTFAVWRYGNCRKSIVDNYIEKKEKNKNNPELLKVYDDLISYENNKCGSIETRPTQELDKPGSMACSELIIKEYLDDEIRKNYNRFSSSREGCFVFRPNTCQEPIKNINSRTVDKLELAKQEELKLKTPLTIPQVPVNKVKGKTEDVVNKAKYIAGKAVTDIKNKFGS